MARKKATTKEDRGLGKPGISVELYHKAKVIAALEDRSVKSIFEEALEEWMQHPKRRYHALFQEEEAKE